MRKALLLVIALLGLATAVPGTAFAQDNSAIDEYTENVPNAGGDERNEQAGGGSGGGGDGEEGSNPLPQGTSEELQRKGSDGGAAAALAEATAPKGSAGGERSDPGAAGGDRNGSSTEPARSGGDDGVPSVSDVVVGLAGSDSDGMGIWLPILLGAALLAALGFLAVRRFRGPGSATHP